MKLLNTSKTFSNGTSVPCELLCDKNAGEWVSMVSYLKNLIENIKDKRQKTKNKKQKNKKQKTNFGAV